MSDSNSHQADVAVVSLRDTGQRIALHLRGELKPLAHGFVIQIARSAVNKRLRLTLAPSQNNPTLMNLTLETGPVGREYYDWHLSYQNIAHLYITWDTPHHVSFCYVQETHFYVFNVGQDLMVSVFSDRDRRLDQPENLKPEAATLRRAFHHIGYVDD